jgi:hypothetical protein
MMDLKFRFDPSDHSYYLGDRRLIGVSEAIQTAGLKDFSRIDPTVLERAQQRGTAVHSACQYLDEGDLDWATVSPEIEPYVRAWERFKKETGVELLGIEKPLFHATLGFAGTPDRVVNLYPHKGIIDLKTYAPDAVTGIQLAGYSYLELGQQSPLDAPKRWGLWLKDDGRYSLTQYTDRGDEAVFMSCLTIAKFKRSQR